MRFGVNVIAAVFLLLSGLLGQELKMLTPSVIDAGTVPSGVYFYRLQIGKNFVANKKMLLIR